VTRDTDRAFTGSIPEIYDSYLVPLIFDEYAADLARRVAERSPDRVLEIAAGTGVATRALAAALPDATSIVATDLNQAMIDYASTRPIHRHVEWRQADAHALPFDAATFDVVVCQFGAMFFPDKPRAFSEVRRVLRPGGVFLFNVWDRIEDNEYADAVTAALASLFPKAPPTFMARLPHGYHDRERIEKDLAEAGFSHAPEIVTLPARSRAASPRVPAVAFCEGTPLRNEIEAHGSNALAIATAAAMDAIARRFGAGASDAKMQAHVVSLNA
jgi:ubiquinone/menaquinone biosynthesis C-methylase UbiE